MEENTQRNINPATQPELPPKIIMARNLVKAMAKHISDGLKKVTIAQFKERLAVCNTCPLRVKNRCTHPKCGCFLEIKAWWSSENCPDDPPHWPSLPIE